MLKKIVSGGQTGVDRGALDAALRIGFLCGGWCPEGRQAEDGPIPGRYPVQVLAGADYAARTRQNVADSDGTVVITFGELAGGTATTVKECEKRGKPYLLIDGCLYSPERAASLIADFLRSQNIEVLNVAGPRESKHAGALDYAESAIAGVIEIELYREQLRQSGDLIPPRNPDPEAEKEIQEIVQQDLLENSEPPTKTRH